MKRILTTLSASKQYDDVISRFFTAVDEDPTDKNQSG